MVNEQKKAAVTTTPRRPDRQVAATQQARFRARRRPELRRVTWPTREEWISATDPDDRLVVGIGLFTFVVDQLFGWLFSLIHPVG